MPMLHLLERIIIANITEGKMIAFANGQKMGNLALMYRVFLGMIWLVSFSGCGWASASSERDRTGDDRSAGRSVELEAVWVEPGRFLLGSDTGQRDEAPMRYESTKGFWVLRHEVTRAAYAACIREGGCKAADDLAGDGAVPARPRHPMTGVDLAEARRFCSHVGMRLPTEVEWEKAARGTDGRRFPWGKEPDCAKANYGNYDDQGACAGKNPGRPEPVGRRPSGRSTWGAEEMAGNVWEWARCFHRACPPGSVGVLRGGSCCSIFLLPRSANRVVMVSTYRDRDIGFRCVVSDVGKKPRSGKRLHFAGRFLMVNLER